MSAKKILGIFLVAVAGGAFSLGVYKLVEKKPVTYIYSNERTPVRQASLETAPAFNEPDFELAASVSVHAVVHIKTEFTRKSSVYDDFFDFFNFGQPYSQRIMPYQAMGSGVIISPDGYIVTNNHVVQEADKISVTLNDKRVFKAAIIGTDRSTDLALIKIDESELPYLQYGNSDEVKIGEWVLAVGNPFNLTSTVTAGIVSAKARDINILGTQGSIESFIQTDAAVNPGNSGGALVNTRGELIGVNAAIASGTGNYVGYSFAIPVNIVKKVVNDLMKFGRTQRVYLGIYYKEIDDQVAREKGLPMVKGILIEDVAEGGPAEQAGIKKGDILLDINGQPVNSKSELMEFIGQHNPGDKVSMKVMRDGQNLDIPITLQMEGGSLAVVKDNKVIIHGATFEKIGDSDRTKFGIEDGFRITRLENGLIRDSGIHEGFIVVAVDKQKVHTTQDLKDALTTRKGGVLIEGVYPNGLRAYYGIGL